MLFDHFDCSTCVQSGKQGDRGCEQPAPIPYWTDSEGEQRDRCPRRPIFEDPHWYNSLIATYNAYKNGFMPEDGGLNSQPALYPETMSVVEGAFNTCERIRMERESGAGKGGASLLGRK